MENRLHCFESAIRLYQEKPWDLFDDHEVFELDKSDFAKHVYCLFCYKGGKKCIRIFHGIESFSDISDYFKPMGYPQIDVFHSFEHDFMEVIFDDPEHLSDEDMLIGETIGLSAREVPVLRIHHRRHYTSELNEQDFAMLQSILDSLYESMSIYLKSGLEIDFNKSRFVFDVKNKSCFSKKTAYRPRKYDIVEVDDEELMSQLHMLEEIDEVGGIPGMLTADKGHAVAAAEGIGGPDVAVGEGIFLLPGAFHEPGMGLAGMAGDKVQKDPQTQPVGFGKKGLQIFIGAVALSHLLIVPDIVAGILKGGIKTGIQPNGITAQAADVGKLFLQTLQVTNTIGIAVIKGLGIHLIKYRVFQPIKHLAPPPRGKASPSVHFAANSGRSPSLPDPEASPKGSPAPGGSSRASEAAPGFCQNRCKRSRGCNFSPGRPYRPPGGP